MDRTRPDRDQHAPFNRHREGQDLRARCRDEGQSLTAALQEARAFFDQGYEAYPPYYEGKHWFLPYDEQLSEALNDNYREWRHLSDGCARLPLLRRLQQREASWRGAILPVPYAATANGDPFDGSARYRLHVPPDAPVRQYWSATLYDFETTLSTERSHSQPRVQFAGPQGKCRRLGRHLPRPQGSRGKKINWVPTKAGGASKRFSGFTVLRNPFSIRAGCCRMSRKLLVAARKKKQLWQVMQEPRKPQKQCRQSRPAKSAHTPRGYRRRFGDAHWSCIEKHILRV